MRIDMPEDPDSEPPAINLSHVITVVLKEKDKVYWYTGAAPHAALSGFSQNGIRKVLREKNAQIKSMYVFIKPSDQSHYKNLVDILDEMSISSINRYAIVDMTAEDEEIITRSNQ
jgi:biopolymer transport protein ExbD